MSVRTTICPPPFLSVPLTDQLKAFVYDMRQTIPDFDVLISHGTASSSLLVHQTLCTLRDDCKLFEPPFDDPIAMARRIVLPADKWVLWLSHMTVTSDTPHTRCKLAIVPMAALDVVHFSIHFGQFTGMFFHIPEKRARERDLPPRAAKRTRK